MKAKEDIIRIISITVLVIILIALIISSIFFPESLHKAMPFYAIGIVIFGVAERKYKNPQKHK